jgi:CheY-like chemotaxis protein
MNSGEPRQQSPKLRLIWLDDDSRAGTRVISDALVTAVKSCHAAADWLAHADAPPDWIVVDLVVPQQGWGGEQFFKTPGLQFLAHLRAQYGSTVRLCAYSGFLTRDKKQLAEAAGAELVLDKASIGFADLVTILQTKEQRH